HIVGLATGFVVGVALLAGRSAAAQRTVRAIGALVIGIGAAVAVLSAGPKPGAPHGPFLAGPKQTIDADNQAVDDRQANKIDNAAFADRVERESIAPWHAMRTRVEVDVGDPVHPLRAYLADREELWRAVVQGVRDPQADSNRVSEHIKELAAKV